MAYPGRILSEEVKPIGKPTTGKRSSGDIRLAIIQFMTSDHVDFAAFLKEMGYPVSFVQRKEARGIASQKRRVRSAMEEQIRQATLAEPLLKREQRKFEVLKQLEDQAGALRQAIQVRLVADLTVTQRQATEDQVTWAMRVKVMQNKGEALRAGELMALAVAQKNVDELMRKASGLEDFDWENAQRNQEMLVKSQKIEFEIVKTTNAKPIDQLPWAPEEKKQA